jgi:diguanylate cyclase (GGDEF)-like protein
VGEPFIRFYAGYPVRDASGMKIGTICVFDTSPREFTQKDKTSLTDFAALIESEIRFNKIINEQINLAKEFERVNQASMVDSLTRLWNRVAIENFLQHQIQLANSTKVSFGIAIIGLDSFKSINDAYGHSAGDAVLCQIAKKLLSGYRDTDKVGRWGDEEFLIIIDEPKANLLSAIANRARELISSTRLICDDNKINVSVTTGVCFYDWKHPVDMATLIACADKALYEGKITGKNTVVESAKTKRRSREP